VAGGGVMMGCLMMEKVNFFAFKYIINYVYYKVGLHKITIQNTQKSILISISF
jgi:hypothetical protein